MSEDSKSAGSTPLAGLEEAEYVGTATDMVPQIMELIGHTSFFEGFTSSDIETLCSYLHVYTAKPGVEIIREGADDDFMLLVISGSINIVKVDSRGEVRPMAVIQSGATVGEMSLIDGEPRFASCITIDSCMFAVLSRDDMVNVILNQSSLSAKVLIKLITQLSQRLRNANSRLIEFMERTDVV